MKLWAGRFSKELDPQINSFNSSIAFDQRLAEQDIKGSLVHAAMLAKQGIISEEDCEKIQAGLEQILSELQSGKLAIDPEAEDIHMFMESVLTARIGDAGKRLHTARSRNDQVALDTKTYLMAQIPQVCGLLRKLLEVLCDQAELYQHTIMPGYTHLQRAQPITFGHHLMAYVQMFVRDQGRLLDCLARMQESCPLGSGALAGTTYPIDRQYTATNLGYNAPSCNSLDGVSDRDYCIEFLSACSLIMMHLSRFSEEMILWCSWEFKFIQLDDAFATGSSIMPQKKNPDITELIRGKTGRVYGDLMGFLTMMKGLPLAYNKDMQEDKEALFDGLDTVTACLTAFIPMLATITVLEDNMRAAASRGFINATDCADYLVGKGLAFRDAYKVTGELVAVCIAQSQTLESLPLAEYKAHCALFEQDVYQAVALETCLHKRTSTGGPADIPAQLTAARKQMHIYAEKLHTF